MRDYIPLLFAYGTLFVLIICVCLVLNARLLDKLKHLGSHNNTPNADWVRWAASPKPAVGGIGFFAAFLLSLLIYTILEKMLWAINGYCLCRTDRAFPLLWLAVWVLP
jgi:UDP-N-acetylmuramyl pentapeptide phosphotransferase/UDP-N-acetylglucosamine-1-phosphate transferase